MNLGKKQYITIGIVVILILAGVFIRQKKSEEGSSAQEATPTSSTWEKDRETDQALVPAGKVLEGTLRLSDNKNRGNLMLKNATTTVYIFTSRDYGSLVGKEVRVIYDGTLEDFRLGDIVEK